MFKKVKTEPVDTTGPSLKRARDDAGPRVTFSTTPPGKPQPVKIEPSAATAQIKFDSNNIRREKKKKDEPDVRFVKFVAGALIKRSIESLVIWNIRDGNDKQVKIYYEYTPDFYYATGQALIRLKNMIDESHEWCDMDNDDLLPILQQHERIAIALAACVAYNMSDATKMMATSLQTRYQMKETEDHDYAVYSQLVSTVERKFPNTIMPEYLI
jgi:hypothetical protein